MTWYGVIFEDGGKAIVEALSIETARIEVEAAQSGKMPNEAAIVEEIQQLSARSGPEAFDEWWGEPDESIEFLDDRK